MVLGSCLFFQDSCQTFLFSDEATFADPGEVDGGAPDTGTQTTGCQGCQKKIAGQCVQAGDHNGEHFRVSSARPSGRPLLERHVCRNRGLRWAAATVCPRLRSRPVSH